MQSIQASFYDLQLKWPRSFSKNSQTSAWSWAGHPASTLSDSILTTPAFLKADRRWSNAISQLLRKAAKQSTVPKNLEPADVDPRWGSRVPVALTFCVSISSILRWTVTYSRNENCRSCPSRNRRGRNRDGSRKDRFTFTSTCRNRIVYRRKCPLLLLTMSISGVDI